MSKGSLLIGTTNRGKIREIAEALKDLDLDIKGLNDFPNIPPPEETGSTFLENAFIKAKYYAEYTGLLTLADDSGLEVEALQGRPGIRSSRFAGPNATDEENINLLLKLLTDVPEENLKARFVCLMVCYHPTGRFIGAEGLWDGKIARKPRGSFGFGYDPVFLVGEFNYQKTAAELPLEIKNQLSHRAKALKKLKDMLPWFLNTLDDL
ncbi:MAG: RdgB/HAM1 family non-canonical purine NTP pyrophosphatase [Caldimicrobium sp.]|nr:RdgB/HAM1 family non-canonical purine NTP pyrophosphatase [Caldimicrobium sp.]MCX7613316.1 RdgB/HAM1 family non-canonical purine NTP pyrophosphatase [Caldimicrobium sp.]MDW8183403.1 RdgB/HAM1 family non-canonical purine NTP pyrophosphatase [Caldimicrobium sp.]